MKQTIAACVGCCLSVTVKIFWLFLTSPNAYLSLHVVGGRCIRRMTFPTLPSKTQWVPINTLQWIKQRSADEYPIESFVMHLFLAPIGRRRRNCEPTYVTTDATSGCRTLTRAMTLQIWQTVCRGRHEKSWNASFDISSFAWSYSMIAVALERAIRFPDDTSTCCIISW